MIDRDIQEIARTATKDVIYVFRSLLMNHEVRDAASEVMEIVTEALKLALLRNDTPKCATTEKDRFADPGHRPPAGRP